MAVDPAQMMGGGGMPPMPPGMMAPDPSMGGMPPDPMMGSAAPGMPDMPSLDPTVLEQLLGPVKQLQAADIAQLQGGQQKTLMDVFMGMLQNAPNPDGYAAQAAPTGTSAPDLSLPPSNDMAV